MRRLTLVGAGWAAWLFMSSGAHAGLYLPADKARLASLGSTPRVLFDTLSDLRAIPPAFTAPSRLREEYQNAVKELEAKQARGELEVIDRINLSGYYLRMMLPGDPKLEKVKRLLEAVPPAERNFMVYANLALAYQLSGSDPFLLQRAQLAQEQAIATWPEDSPYYNRRLLSWYLRAEKYHLKLLQLRNREATRGERQPSRGFGRAENAITVDPLFPGIPAKDAKGGYLLGPLYPKAAEGVPEEAYLITWQLVLWLPFDDRLYWLLGEVANAEEADFAVAYAILDELRVRRNFDPRSRDLIEHRETLREAKDIAQALYHEARADNWKRLLAEKASKPPVMLHGMLPPGVSAVLDPTATVQVVQTLMKDPTPIKEEERPTVETPVKTLLDWRQLGVGFLVGALVTLFGSLQLRELRRRRQTRHTGLESVKQG